MENHSATFYIFTIKKTPLIQATKKTNIENELQFRHQSEAEKKTCDFQFAKFPLFSLINVFVHFVLDAF